MALIKISEAMAQRLAVMARQQNRPIEEIVEAILEQNVMEEMPVQTDDEEVPPLGTLARLAYSAERANLRSDVEVDTSENSREILHNEFADYLLRRIRDDAHE